MIPNKRTGHAEIRIIIACVFVLIIFMVIELNCHCFTDRYSLTFSIVTGLLTGLISAIALLYFQERYYENKINKYYLEIAGSYKRIGIGQDETSSQNNDNLQTQNLNLDIVLRHIKGSHSLKIVADYWTDENAKVEATIEFNEKNGTTASGRYRYTAGKSYINDSGIYKIYRLEEDKTKLLVLYQKLFPRKFEDQTDKNKGWEIWQKQ